ncbi:MAG TPA: hypothetical protein VNN79_09935 [Actinomycetota bacterium]|nr:hypothetical protein [Actinomycetota bacterium]
MINRRISEQDAVAIAADNARRVYRDLSVYRVVVSLIDDDWHVDYELTDPNMVGGGPHYVISAETGEITSYRYEQ